MIRQIFRYSQIIVLCFVSFVFLSALVSAEEKIKIGVSLPLSGGSASEGVDLQRMLSFANREIGQNLYELRFEDDQCSDKQAVSIAHKFADIDQVKYVLGFACSGAVLASAPVYEKAKIPVIALATGAPDISNAGDYIFRTIPSLSIAAKKLYEHATAHYKNVGILSEETAYCQGLATAFVNENTNGKIQVATESYLPTTTDFRTIFAKLRQRGVEAIFLNPQSETGMIQLYQQLLDSNWKVPVYAAYYPGFSEFLKKFESKGDGIIFADLPFLSDSLKEDGQALYAKYKKENGIPQSSEFYFITALAAFHALHSAIQSGMDVHTYLYSHPFDRFFGHFTFDKNGDVQGDRLTFVLKTLQNGKSLPL